MSNSSRAKVQRPVCGRDFAEYHLATSYVNRRSIRAKPSTDLELIDTALCRRRDGYEKRLLGSLYIDVDWPTPRS
jgi:hypothetical protein